MRFDGTVESAEKIVEWIKSADDSIDTMFSVARNGISVSEFNIYGNNDGYHNEIKADDFCYKDV